MGLLSSPGDPEGLAANVILILEQPEFAQSLARRAPKSRKLCVGQSARSLVANLPIAFRVNN
jgi:hypothetical protein